MRALATGKSYTIGQRTLSRADEKWVTEQFEKYDAIVDALKAGRNDGARAVRIVPRDL